MKLLFAYEIDEGIHGKLDEIQVHTDLIEKEAEKLKTISGLEYIGVKLILQEAVEGFEDFIKPQKVKYKKRFIQKNPILGDETYEGYISFEILFTQSSYFKLVSSTCESEIKSILKTELLKSEKAFTEVKNKVGDLDISEFEEFISSSLI